MVDFKKCTRILSEAVPGVSYTVRHSTERRRRQLREMVAETQAKLRRLSVRAMRFEDEAVELTKRGERQSDEDYAAYLALRQEMDVLQAEEIDPLWIVWTVSEVTGCRETPFEPSVGDLLDFPSPLYNEMLGYARREVLQTPEIVKNSASPSTSTGPVAGETQPTTATSAATTTAS